MAQINTREIVLLGNVTVTTSGSGSDINAIQGWQASVVSINVTSASGTLPTLDVYIQRKLGQPAATDLAGGFPTGTAIYDDLLHFTQMTTTGIRISKLLTATSFGAANTSSTSGGDSAQNNLALGSGLARIGPIGGIWKVSYVIGGTTPSFTFSLCVQLIPWAT